MRVVLELTTDELEEFTRNLKDPDAVKNIKEWDTWIGWWQKANESGLKDVMAECLCSTGQYYLASGYQQFLKKGVVGLWKRPKPEIRRILTKYGIRWPVKKSIQLDFLKQAKLLDAMKYIAKNHSGGTLADERKARDYLLGLGVKGLGLKQASNFLRQIDFARNIVPLDSRWLNRMWRIMSLTDHERVDYVILEDVVVDIAGKLGVEPVVLDAAVWTAEG